MLMLNLNRYDLFVAEGCVYVAILAVKGSSREVMKRSGILTEIRLLGMSTI